MANETKESNLTSVVDQLRNLSYRVNGLHAKCRFFVPLDVKLQILGWLTRAEVSAMLVVAKSWATLPSNDRAARSIYQRFFGQCTARLDRLFDASSWTARLSLRCKAERNLFSAGLDKSLRGLSSVRTLTVPVTWCGAYDAENRYLWSCQTKKKVDLHDGSTKTYTEERSPAADYYKRGILNDPDAVVHYEKTSRTLSITYHAHTLTTDNPARELSVPLDRKVVGEFDVYVLSDPHTNTVRIYGNTKDHYSNYACSLIDLVTGKQIIVDGNRSVTGNARSILAFGTFYHCVDSGVAGTPSHRTPNVLTDVAFDCPWASAIAVTNKFLIASFGTALLAVHNRVTGKLLHHCKLPPDVKVQDISSDEMHSKVLILARDGRLLLLSPNGKTLLQIHQVTGYSGYDGTHADPHIALFNERFIVVINRWQEKALVLDLAGTVNVQTRKRRRLLS